MEMSGVVEKKSISTRCRKFAAKHKSKKGFTLVELLTVVGAISVLTGILLPVLEKARRQAKAIKGISNQRQIVYVVNLFAMENDGKYPESVATIGFGSHWHWQEPTMITACRPRERRLHRSMSAYLGSYIRDASILFCPNAPSKYKYLQEAWDAGDDWNNPETTGPLLDFDPVSGTYCFYWSYIGFLGGRRGLFRGPRSLSGGRGESKLLVTDYFGYDHWRSQNAYGSCEKFRRADITDGTCVSSAYWSRLKSDEISLERLTIKLHAGYTDGHVASYTPSEVVPMRVSVTSDGSVPYPDGTGPGVFYLPGDSLP